MPRLREVPPDEAHEAARNMYKFLFGDRNPVTDPGTATGTSGNWWTVFAGVPDVFDHALASNGADHRRRLPVAMCRRKATSLTDPGTPIEARHVCLCARFIQEHKAVPAHEASRDPKVPPPLDNIRTALLAGDQ